MTNVIPDANDQVFKGVKMGTAPSAQTTNFISIPYIPPVHSHFQNIVLQQLKYSRKNMKVSIIVVNSHN